MDGCGSSELRPRITVARNRSVRRILNDLGLSDAYPVLLVAGGAATLDPAVMPRLSRLFERTVVPAVEVSGGVVVDGGTDAGVMGLVGRAFRSSRVPVVGVAPRGVIDAPGVRLEPNHSHVILSDGHGWGSETPLLFDVAAAIAGPHATVVLVAGGGSVTNAELREATRRRLPILALAGTGGTADEVVAGSLSGLAGEATIAALPAEVDSAEIGRWLMSGLSGPGVRQPG